MKTRLNVGLVVLAAFALASCAQPRPHDRRAKLPSPVSSPSAPAIPDAAGSRAPGGGIPRGAVVSDPPGLMGAGRQLFLKNCGHCHGADAHGDECPDLHHLDWPDEQIATRIRNGKKGEMTAFAGRLSPQEIAQVVAYVQTLK